MGLIRNILVASLIWITSLTNLWAQDDDKGFLTRSIQDALSGAGRTVSIDGFSGALSSQASFDRMTISDKDGVWLTLEGAVLSWTRSALLRGRLEVESLSAKRLDVPRLPVSDAETLPDAQATPFSLPQLPVSIDIAAFAVDEINLGAALLGEQAQLSVNAKARLTDEVANVDFQATRTDGKTGEFAIKADFQRSDTMLALLVKLTEQENGIASRLLNLPGHPSIEMSIDGTGALDDFTSDLRIATEGDERLTGQVSLKSQAPRRTSDTPDLRILADIGGDITKLLAPQYRDFFGTDVRLTLDALRESTGALEIRDFAIAAQAVDLQGKININAESWPTFMKVTGTISDPNGQPILLPLGGAGTRVKRVGLRVDYDAENGETFGADFDIAALTTAGVSIAQTTLALDGILQGNLGSVGQFLGDMTFAADGLVLDDAASAEAIGERITGRANINFIEGQPVRISDLNLSGADYALTGKAVINGFEAGGLTRLDMALNADDLSRFSALAGRELDGQTTLALKGVVTPLSGEFDLAASGSTQDLRLGIAQADAVLAGHTVLNVQALRDQTGTYLRDLVLENDALSLTGAVQLRGATNSEVEARFRLNDLSIVVPQYDGPVTVVAQASQDAAGWHVDASADGPYGAKLAAKGLATGPEAALSFSADMPDVKPFAAGFGQQIDGPLNARGTLNRTADGWRIETNAKGPYAVQAAVAGDVAPMIDVRFDMSMPNIRPLVPQVNGPVAAAGRLQQTDQGFFVDTTASGPYGTRAMVEGLATGPDMTLTFDVSLPNVSPLLPSVNGSFQAKGVLRQTPDGISVVTNATGPYATRASAQGVVTGPAAAVNFDLAMPNIGVLVDRVSGPLAVTGSAHKQGLGWRLDTSATGPSGTQSTIAGLVNTDGTADLDIAGTAPLGLSGPFIAPRNLQGMARFDLALNGPLALSSLRGSIQTSDAKLSAPDLRVTLRGINADVQLANSRATLGITGDVLDGGRIRLGGGVTLTPSLPADIAIVLQDVALIDPRLYRTSISGNLRVAGPLSGGASIAGHLNIGETNVNVPSTGLTSIGDIPQITHINAKPGVGATRAKAGLTGANAGSDPADQSGGAGFGLDVRVNAPNRIFVRGRGLDAELGGAIGISGSTNRVITAGKFELLRGRLDILGKRFELREGSIQFQGDLIPYIRFVSATTSWVGEVRVIVEGPADEPVVTFESTPEGPSDEVLSQLLFGRNISEISAFQALQLASAVATLAGRGGSGIIGNLREGFGLDDLDVTTTEDGVAALRFGKYLTDNIYTDVTAGSDGNAEVSLNLDISSHLKAKGTLGTDGDSSIGIFFEKDY